LIEELEAHLHPQAQMKVIEAFQNETDVQFILTTHSPNLASKVKIDNLLMCDEKNIFPLRESKLSSNNYTYLERFLDVTKSNLFFAKGVILVEGWSEEILIPTIAKQIGYDLTKIEVSIVNVGSTAYLHFAKIFLRDDNNRINTRVSIVTDLDNRPDDNGIFDDDEKKKKEDKIKLQKEFENTNVEMFVAKEWTLEWCLYKSSSLSEFFKESVSEIHSKTKEFEKINDSFDNEKFEEKLCEKLKNRTLDKVAIANVLSNKIEKSNINHYDNDDYINYIIKAIKYVCGNK